MLFNKLLHLFMQLLTTDGAGTTMNGSMNSYRAHPYGATSSFSRRLSSPFMKLVFSLMIVGTIKVALDVRTVFDASPAVPSKGSELGTVPIRNLQGTSSAHFINDPTYRSTQGIDMMQVVRTRFMQRQPNLKTLGKARLELFKTFCLPTMLKQTLQDFAWLVFTDPDLDPELLQELESLLKEHNNFYLVLSNDNEMTVPDLVEKARTNKAMVKTGNLEYLTRSIDEQAQSKASVVLYIETGLDADDGLQKDTLSEIQKHAVAETYLWNSPTQRSASYHWFILCVGNHYEWKNQAAMEGKSKDMKGLIGEHHNRRRCVTPGLTMVNSLTAPHDIEQERSSIFGMAPFPYNELVVNHWRLNEKYPNCRKHGANEFEPCWKQINNNDKSHTAIRARTITSTGMKDVMVTTKEEQKFSDSLWDMLNSSFGIVQSRVALTSQWLYDNRVVVVSELIKGRCNKGHSCLEQTDKDLKLLLKKIQRNEQEEE